MLKRKTQEFYKDGEYRDVFSRKSAYKIRIFCLGQKNIILVKEKSGFFFHQI